MARTKNEELHKKRKAQILKAAQKCFIEKGIHKATMQDICRVGKISPGALYRYFASKQSIIAALAEHEQLENTALIEFLRNAIDPLQALLDAVPDITAFLLDHDHARFLVEISSEASRNPDVFEKFDAIERRFKADMIDIFLKAKKEKRFQTGANIESAVSTLLALFDGIVAQAATAGMPKKRYVESDMKKVINALFKT